MILPALKDASTDRQLRGAEVRILVYLHTLLIPGEFRVLTLDSVAPFVHMNRATVSKALKRLTTQGYIREGPRQERGERAFMLVGVRGDPAKRTA